MSLLSVGASLLGGLFGRSSERRQRATQLQTMVADANAAGINPLTALRAGAAMNYGPTNELASAQFMADALAQGIDRWSNRESIAAQREAQVLENQIRREELRQLQNDARPFEAQFGYNISEQRIVTPAQRKVPATLQSDPRTSVFGFDWEPADRIVPVENLSLTTDYRTGADNGFTFRSLSPDSFEIGVGEIIGAGLVHGVAAGVEGARHLKEDFKTSDHGTNRGNQGRDMTPWHFPQPSTRPSRRVPVR